MHKYIVNYRLKRPGLPDVTVSPETYFDDFKRRIQSMIGAVESICYMHEDGKNKTEWSQFTADMFQSFRKKMLDIADEVGELPENTMIETLNDDESESTVRELIRGLKIFKE